MSRLRIYILIYILLLVPRTVGAASADAAHKLFMTGESCYAKRQYSLAMKSYLDALGIAENHGDTALVACIYIGVGNLYSTQDDYEMGLQYYRKALALSHSVGDRSLQNKVLNNLVGASCFAGHVDEGRRYQQSLEANRESSCEYNFNLLMSRGLIATYMNTPQKAVAQYRHALAYATSKRMNRACRDAVFSCLAQLYMDTCRPDSAIHYLRMNERSAIDTGQKDLLVETLRLLADAYGLKGDAARSMQCKLRYVDLWDSLHIADDFNAMKTTQFLYESAKSTSKINTLKHQNQLGEQQIRMRNRWILTLAAAFAIFVVMLVVVYRQKRQLSIAYNELYDRSQAAMASVGGHSQKGSLKPATASSAMTPEQRERLLDSIRQAMDCTLDFCSSDFSIEKLAALVGSNSRYVSEAINDGYGKNFRTFLNEYRIKIAMQRLADSEHYGGYTIKAISESVGYKSQANFITVFTKATGMKPSIYQKISRERK